MISFLFSANAASRAIDPISTVISKIACLTRNDSNGFGQLHASPLVDKLNVPSRVKRADVTALVIKGANLRELFHDSFDVFWPKPLTNLFYDLNLCINTPQTKFWRKIFFLLGYVNDSLLLL